MRNDMISGQSSEEPVGGDCSERSSEDYDPEELDEEEAQGTSEESDPDELKDVANSNEEPVELTEEAYEEVLAQPYTDNSYKKNGHSIKEARGKSCEEPSGLSPLPVDTINNDIHYHVKPVTTDSSEKERSVDANDGNCHMAKKCKPDHYFELRTDSGSASMPQKCSDVPNAFISAANAFEQQDQSGSSGKRRRSRWEPQPECDVQGESDKTAKRRKTRWDDDDSHPKAPGPIQLPDFVKKLVKADLDPTYKTPPEKPPLFRKTLYVPYREYPNYNFMGLILGPQGRTIMKMEKETGARIMLRGKGPRSTDERRRLKYVPCLEAAPRVKIEADNQKSLDDAVGMVEKLLIPVQEGMSKHKRNQLRELAKLTGNYGYGKTCRICHEKGHMGFSCPTRTSVSHCDSSCATCGGSTHSTANCPLTVSNPSSYVANKGKSFLADPGGSGGITFSSPQVSSRIPWQGGNTGFDVSNHGSNFHSGPGSTPKTNGSPAREFDDGTILVSHLPKTVDDIRLRDLFTPFGRVIEANVVKGRITGSSKGFGFVKYDSHVTAAMAVTGMNGFMIGGKVLVVKLAPKSPAVVSWPGPPGSMLPDPQFSSSKNENFCLPPTSVFFGITDSSSERLASSHHAPISSPASLEKFPGNPAYPGSVHSSYFTPPSSFYSQYLQGFRF